jgi:hypothetical protein
VSDKGALSQQSMYSGRDCPVCPYISLLQYKKAENQFYIFADDIAPRFVTSVLPLDFDTFAVADKFGNLGVLRLPEDVSAQVGARCCGCPLLTFTSNMEVLQRCSQLPVSHTPGSTAFQGSTSVKWLSRG